MELKENLMERIVEDLQSKNEYLEKINNIDGQLFDNFKIQIEILKSMITDRDKYIGILEKQLLIQDSYLNE